jgi:hypothetical protein
MENYTKPVAQTDTSTFVSDLLNFGLRKVTNNHNGSHKNRGKENERDESGKSDKRDKRDER